MACWLAQPTANNDFCDEIDEIMKHEHEDVILLDEALSSGTNLDLEIDSISDFLDNPSTVPGTVTTPAVASAVSPMSPVSTTDYSQPLNIYAVQPTTFPLTNNSQTNTAASAYSSLGISPQFTTLSINPHQHPFSPNSQETNNSSTHLQPFGQSSFLLNSKNNLRPPPYVQSQQQIPQIQQQQDNSVLGTSYPFQLQLNNDALDVKRFRSASMNEGATQQHQTKLDPLLFDPYRFKASAYGNPPYYHSRTTSSTNTTATTTSSTSSLSTDVSSNSAWPFAGPPRPASSSFSEVLDQQQQLRLQNNLSASYGGSSFYSLNQRSQPEFLPNMNFQTPQTTNCTLYSLNQPTAGGATSPPPLNSTVLTRKRPSIVGFSVDDIKVDPSSPNCTVEQQSEPDLWSDIEQNSCDQIQDNDNEGDDISSDDDTTISTGFDTDLASTKPSHLHSNAASLFWQYNVQAKGPKTKRILYLKERDPHLFREFSDPVYQIKLTQTKGHTLTKLRKGDGNDVTPNPVKLYQLGKQIRDLSSFVGKSNGNQASVYHGIYHAEHTTNSNDTIEVKKEKNKIASRACRLRKKAQHEANKLKLHGLNEEHKTLIDLIASIKLMILKRYQDGQPVGPASSPDQSFEVIFDQLVTQKYTHPVAGNTDGFVQGILNDMEQLYTTKQQRSSSLNT